MANYLNITESGIIKSKAGKLEGIIVNSHSSGTLKLTDGDENGVAATGTLTSTGACVPAVYGGSTLTSDTTNVAEDETVTIGAVVYTFKDTPALAYEVAVGSDAEESLANLSEAINGGLAGTTAHPQFISDTAQLSATELVIVSRTIGTAAETAVINALVTEETSDHLSWTGADIANGVASVTSDAATITIGDVTYTAVTGLAETYGLDSVANQVLWVTSEAVFLDNLKLAINESGTAGTEYSAATVEHPTVKATTNAADAQTVEAKFTGTNGNLIATTETLGNYAWGAATLTGGTGDEISTIIMDTYTLPSGSSVISFDNPIHFDRGLYAVIGGTSANVTLIYE